MRLARAVLTSGIIGATMTACDQAPIAPRPVPTAALASASRGMAGMCRTTYEVSSLTFLPPPNDNILASLTATHTGTCEMGHLGLTKLTKTETSTFDQGGGHVRGGQVTFIAANGDELHGIESADLGAPDANGVFRFTGSWAFDGGTGRFESAAGLVQWSGFGSIPAATTERSFRGWISY